MLESLPRAVAKLRQYLVAKGQVCALRAASADSKITAVADVSGAQQPVV